jgi:dTDP-4-amino-4,6-dideoxygalactose transaminase
VIAAINAESIPCTSGSCSEIYLEKAFVDAGFAPATRQPIAQRLGATSLSFLVHPTLTDADMRDTCAAVAKVMRAAAQP